MSLRQLKWLALIAAALSGALLSPDILSGDPARMLVTFLGLVSASILPTASLVIGSMAGTGRSVKQIVGLFEELQGAIRALFSTFGLVALAFGMLLVFTMVPRWDLRVTVQGIEVVVLDLPRRCVQVLVAISSVVAAIRAIKVPDLLLRVLEIKAEIAVFEARKSLREQAPTEADVKQMFKKKEGFGVSVVLERSEH
ncbi:hypothetical protein GVY41_11220 [Frigidibacter albus]|uniref:Uncharacterized protein n=1 Tax=Frigidibacter albus TaxID=1465486 RepID=A0A6L8VHG8_9RHOB|nr:hypothetical protein [Frigidibacter albus]MZQ89663.1 hypothetical protein [Frigidibacter albus]NBE31569.1 hypothetical protein [Frigidibacter albus]GGH54804.1 hypothetical protein GCM10011341_21650 [Frigidibacter albus]